MLNFNFFRKKFFVVLLFCLVGSMGVVCFSSCVSQLGGSTYINAIEDKDREALDQIQNSLLQEWVFFNDGGQKEKQEALLQTAQTKIANLKLQETVNKVFTARLMGLDSWVLFRRGKDINFNEVVKKLESLSTRDEFYFIFQSFLERNPKGKVAKLEEGVQKGMTKSFSSILLAQALFKIRSYERAAVLIDELVLTLPEYSHQWLIKERKRAVAMQKAANQSQSTELNSDQILERGKLTIGEMLLVMNRLSKFLSTLGSGKKASEDSLFLLGKEYQYLLPSVEQHSIATRRDVAWLFMVIIAQQEANPELRTSYLDFYSSESVNESPISDVSIDDPAFNAILLVVEKGMMDLIDGFSFEPSRPISPDNYFNRINQLKQMY